MRYPKEHKEEVRARIVAAASDQLRRGGVASISIAKLMRKIGLTHGGFYAHFKSRDALVLEALLSAMNETIAGWQHITENEPDSNQLGVLLHGYFNPKQSIGLKGRCPVSLCVGDLTRSSIPVKRQFSKKLDEIFETLTSTLPVGLTEDRRQVAIATFATMVGTLLLARAVEKKTDADEIVDAALKSIERAMENSKAAPALRAQIRSQK